MATAQITALTNDGLTANGPANFSGVTNLSGTVVTVNAGGSLNMRQASDIDAASFIVHSGILSLPALAVTRRRWPGASRCTCGRTGPAVNSISPT